MYEAMYITPSHNKLVIIICVLQHFQHITTDQPQSVSYRKTITPDTYADDPIFHNIEQTLHNAYDENGSEIQLNNDESEGNE